VSVRPPRAPPLWRKLLPLIGLAVLAWLLTRLDLPALGRAIAQVSWAALLGACASFSFNLWLKVLRWQRLLRAQAIVLPHRVALASFMSAQFYAQVSVGRVGEFLRMEALIERGVSAGTALSSCVFDRLLDVYLVLATGAVLGLSVLGDRQLAIAAAAVLALGSIAGSVFLVRLGRAARVHSEPTGSAAPRELWTRLRGAVSELARSTLPLLSPAPLLEAVLWTLIAWAFYFAALYILADALAIHVSRVLLTATGAVAALSSLLPVTISGLGAREAIYIAVLSAHEVPGEKAVALSLLHLSVMTATAIVLGLGGVVLRGGGAPGIYCRPPIIFKKNNI
jgi:uncharacterized protein (TIRG00374 family)